jgi:hypothetical protein
LIFAGVDGTTNVLIVIFSSIAAGKNPNEVLAFGLSIVIGDGLAMSLGDYLSSKAEM